MKIAFFETESWEQKIIEERLSDHELQFFSEPLNDDFATDLRDIEALSVFIYSSVTAKVLKKMPNLKLIVTRSTGFDHIDISAANNYGIKVSNVPTYGENTVAEHTFALILALSRKIVPSVERVKRGEFTVDGLRGFDLFGKTLGIVGTGKIGANVARIANSFGMKLLGFDKFPNPELTKNYKLQYVSLKELLGASDVVSLNLRHTAETHHLINKETIAYFKPGAVLINTARGGLIDTPILVEALSSGILAGVGLDVLEDEGVIKEDAQILSKQFPKRSMMLNIANNILIRQPNVVITPHNAFNSKEALERILDTTLENIIAFSAGKIVNLIEKE